MPIQLKPRRGIALITAVLAVVVITILVLGGLFASTQEFRSGRNLLVEQRAFAVAEYGLNSEVVNWDKQRNLPASAGTFAIGQVDNTRRYVADGDTAFVRITRLNETSFWVTSHGRSNMGFNQMEAQRTTNAFVRIAYPAINPNGAITAAGDVDLNGNFKVDGESRTPPGWDAQCASYPAETVAALRVSPTADVEYKEQNIISSPAIERDESAADPDTYIRYGSETWESLAANADIKIPVSGLPGSNVLPVGTDTTCDVSTATLNMMNWGEPHRPPASGVVKGCYGRYPIIYSAGDLIINSNGRGQGILLVNGDLRINGTFDFYGLVIVKDDINKGNGTATIYGAVYARNYDNEGAASFSGTQDVYYSKCAVESALRGSAILTRVKHRHWTQLY